MTHLSAGTTHNLLCALRPDSAISGRSLDDMNGSVRAHLTEVIDRKSMKKTVRKPETQ